VEIAATQQRPTKGFEQAAERIEPDNRSEARRHRRRGVRDRTRVHHERDQHRQHVLYVAIAHRQCARKQPESQRHQQNKQHPDGEQQEAGSGRNVISNQQQRHQACGDDKID